jgi:hypothetical protein
MTDLRQAAQQEPVAWMYTSRFAGNQKYITWFQHDLTTYKADKVWALYTTPPAAPEQEPKITHEQHIALREAFAIGSADSYFEAYPTHDNDAGRMLFERGFARGFDSHKRAIEAALREALEQPEQEQALKKLADLGQEIEQEPTCPKCKAAVLYECVACSSNNYPPKPEQEPVAFAAEIVEDVNGVLSTQWADWWIPNEGDKLYTTLPAAQRPWVGLTDEEITEIYEMGLGVRASIETALDKLEERNT